MLLVVDTYGSYEYDLHYTLLVERGYEFVDVLTLEDTGFVPNDVSSPWLELTNQPTEGRPLHLSHYPLHSDYEFLVENDIAQFKDDYSTVAQVTFHGPSLNRIVESVTWLSPQGKPTEVEHYTSKGTLYKKDIYFNSSLALSHYYTPSKKLVLTCHHTTGIYEYFGEEYQTFSSFEELSTWFLQKKLPRDGYLGTTSLTLLNHPSLKDYHKNLYYNFSPLTSEGTLVGAYTNFLGQPNTHVYLTNPLVQERLEALSLLTKERLYSLKLPKVSGIGNPEEVLITTNTDNIPLLEPLLQACPKHTFHVYAPTEMSVVLKDLQVNYSNLVLHPVATQTQVLDGMLTAGVFLDIAYTDTVFNANRLALENSCLRLGIQGISGDYIPSPSLFSDFVALPSITNTLNFILNSDNPQTTLSNLVESQNIVLGYKV